MSIRSPSGTVSMSRLARISEPTIMIARFTASDSRTPAAA
jgi:hypothetical protein